MPPQKKQRTRVNEKEISGAGSSAQGASARRAGGNSRKPATKKPRRPRASGRAGLQTQNPVTGSSVSAASSRKTQDLSSKVALPGDLYQRTGQWWWRVRLPGEDKTKARPLKEPGAKEAASDRNAAEKIALEMWEQAVMQYGTRQITLECGAKVERLKAQFLDKVRHLTDIVNTATVRAEAEAQARAEAEARLNAVLQAAEQRTPPPADASCVVRDASCVAAPLSPDAERTMQDAQCGMPCPSVPCIPPEPAQPAAHTSDSQANEDSRPATPDVLFDAVDAPDGERTLCTAQPASPIETEDRDPQPQTGDCECCGAMDIPTTDLERIDSGQRLCRECFHALHLDIARIEVSASAEERL